MQVKIAMTHHFMPIVQTNIYKSTMSSVGEDVGRKDLSHSALFFKNQLGIIFESRLSPTLYTYAIDTLAVALTGHTYKMFIAALVDKIENL